MALTLTTNELAEIRLLVGARVTSFELTDAQIQSDIVLGTATDFVYESVRKDIDLTKLDATQAAAATRVYDDTEDDVDAFVSDVLKPPQNNQFRRAVFFYGAGLCIPMVQQIESESAGTITQKLQTQQWQQKQANYFARSNDEINKIRDAFPDDAFQSSAAQAPKINFFTLTNV